MRDTSADYEVRHVDGLRAATESGVPTLVGYAIRSNVLSEDLGGFRERITPEAIRAALDAGPDLVALQNHDTSRVLGRMSAKTLTVAADDQGLRFEITPPSHATDLIESVQRGDVTGASFAFRVPPGGESWDFSATPPLRTVTDMRLRELSVGVPFPAFPQTVVAALRSLEQARAATKETPVSMPIADPVPPVAPSLDTQWQHEVRAFSLRALLAGAAGLPNVEWGRERELSAEIAKRAGRPFQGFAVPLSVFEERVVTTTLPAPGPGSNIIATDLRGDQFIDRLRAALVIRRLGAIVLTGLVGNVALPRLKASATSYWFADNSPITASDVQLDQVTLSPKHVGTLTEFSRNMLLQSTPDIEEILRNDFAAVIARAIDTVAITGGGTNEPVGILATSGIGDVPVGTNGGPPTWALLNALTAVVEQADATPSAFLSNFKVAAKLRGTVKLAGGTDSTMLLEGDTLLGYPISFTSLVPSNLTKGTSTGVCSALIFGNFSDLLLGFWSELDVLVNPYESTAYPKGNVQVRAICTVDIGIRHAASFGAIKDLTTT
jgi:HK97 family phage major capsid protein/HK97 family phage prohead protease